MKTAVETKPVVVELKYRPLPKQGDFHVLPHKYRAFIGGWGNGKTSAGCAECFAMALEYPGCTGLIARKTRPELKSTTLDVLLHGGQGAEETDWQGIPQEVIRTHNKTDGLITLINGSKIRYWPLDDADKLSNINLGWFMIDQAEEVPEEMFQMLEGRLRQQDSPRKGILLANPAGHDWIWRRFVHLQYPDHGYVHATTLDNPTLPSDYIDTLMHMPESWVERFVQGSFEVFTGQIFPEFDPKVHTINPLHVPEWWEIFEGGDHGRRNPTAWLWAATDDADNLFIVDEHYEAGRLVGHHAKAMLKKREIWGEPEDTVIDAQAAQEDPNTGRSVLDEYNDHGIYPVQSDRQVFARINRMAEWMALDPKHPHPITGETREEGWPHLWIFKSCVNLIEHLPQYKWKPQPPTQDHDAKEEPLKKDDHDVDALGYLLMRRPPPSTRPRDNRPGSSDWYWDRIRDRMDGRTNKGHSMLGTES